MTLETPVQPVPAARRRVGVMAGLAVVAIALLVWHPWAMPSGPGDRSADGPQPAATLTAPSTPASPTLRPRVEALPQAPDGTTARVPTVDVFQPVWSVVGVQQLTQDALWIFQQPIPPPSGTGGPAGLAEACHEGSGAPRLVIWPVARLFLIGIAAPARELAGATEVVREGSHEGLALPADQVRLDAEAAHEPATAAVRLFALPDLEPWPEGAYRFDTADAGEAPRSVYLCLASPAATSRISGRPSLMPT